MQSQRKEGDDGELTSAGLGLSAEGWAVDPAALKEKVIPLCFGITSAACQHQAFLYLFLYSSLFQSLNLIG